MACSRCVLPSPTWPWRKSGLKRGGVPASCGRGGPGSVRGELVAAADLEGREGQAAVERRGSDRVRDFLGGLGDGPRRRRRRFTREAVGREQRRCDRLRLRRHQSRRAAHHDLDDLDTRLDPAQGLPQRLGIAAGDPCPQEVRRQADNGAAALDGFDLKPAEPGVRDLGARATPSGWPECGRLGRRHGKGWRGRRARS